MDSQISALISASAALGGVALSQIFTLVFSLIEKRHQKNILLRQKYEEMMFQFQESLGYVQAVQTCTTREQLFSLTHSPQAGKSLGLCLLYFNHLSDPMKQYIQAQVEFYSSVLTIFNENLPDLTRTYLPMLEVRQCFQKVTKQFLKS